MATPLAIWAPQGARGGQNHAKSLKFIKFSYNFLETKHIYSKPEFLEHIFFNLESAKWDCFCLA
jgi:hypothetical protein